MPEFLSKSEENMQGYDAEAKLASWLQNPEDEAWDNIEQLIVLEEHARTTEDKANKPSRQQLETLEKRLTSTIADFWVNTQSVPLGLFSKHQLNKLIDVAKFRAKLHPQRNKVKKGGELYKSDKTYKQKWLEMADRVTRERDGRFPPEEKDQSPRTPLRNRPAA